MRRTSLLIQGCLNLYDAVRDGTLSSIVFWYPSLKNDQTLSMLFLGVWPRIIDFESSLHISFIPWMLALPHIKIVLLVGFCHVMGICESIKIA